MTPEQYEQFKTELDAFQRSPGYDLEQRIRSAEMIRHTVAENAVELEGALLAFQQPAMLPLMLQEHRDRLEQFLLLVTRRLYNHLATAASFVEHLDRLFRKMPDSLNDCRHRVREEVARYSDGAHHRLVKRLRDHSIHHQLHATSGQLTFGGASDATNASDNW